MNITKKLLLPSLAAIAFLSQIYWIISLNYPPSPEQIGLNIDSSPLLWTSRIISLLPILTSIYLFSLTLKKPRYIYWLLILISPAIPVIWATSPLSCLSLLILSLLVFLLHCKKIPFLASLAFFISFLFFTNHFLLRHTPSVFPTLSLKNSQNIVTQRFTTEDSISPHIFLPSPFKRLAYNKYFITIQNFSNYSLTFLDTESLFFQEIHPQNTKSLVLFYWPQSLLFIFSLYLLSKNRFPLSASFFLQILILAFIYFLSSDTAPYQKLLPLLFIISLLLAIGIDLAVSSRQKFEKVILYSILLLTFYGFLTNLYDRSVRPLHWLDNRPAAYQKLFTLAKNSNYADYNSVVVSDTIGSASSYCHFFLADCSHFTFSNFDLTVTPPQPHILYLGLPGNFFSPNPANFFSDDYSSTLLQKNLLLLGLDSFPDNIANRYGQEPIAATLKP